MEVKNKLRLEELSFNELIPIKIGKDAKNKILYGIKRHVKLQLNKLSNSLNRNGWVFPIVVAETPDGKKYLIDGYCRWEQEDPKQTIGGLPIKKHTALIVPAKDFNHVKELYLQIQSNYGTPTWDDFKKLDSNTSESDYELPGLTHPNFDLSTMTRAEVAQAMLTSKYQII